MKLFINNVAQFTAYLANAFNYNIYLNLLIKESMADDLHEDWWVKDDTVDTKDIHLNG